MSNPTTTTLTALEINRDYAANLGMPPTVKVLYLGDDQWLGVRPNGDTRRMTSAAMLASKSVTPEAIDILTRLAVPKN